MNAEIYKILSNSLNNNFSSIHHQFHRIMSNIGNRHSQYNYDYGHCPYRFALHSLLRLIRILAGKDFFHIMVVMCAVTST